MSDYPLVEGYTLHKHRCTEDPHLAGCTGNGSESCWHCGGEGWVERAFSDDPYDVDTIRCYVCDGEGDIRCPGCEAI